MKFPDFYYAVGVKQIPSGSRILFEAADLQSLGKERGPRFGGKQSQARVYTWASPLRASVSLHVMLASRSCSEQGAGSWSACDSCWTVATLGHVGIFVGSLAVPVPSLPCSEPTLGPSALGTKIPFLPRVLRDLPQTWPLDPHRASSPDSETLSRTSLGLNLAPGMAMMPTVTIRRKIRGDVGRAVTLPGTRGQCPSGSSHSVLHVHIHYRPCFRADATQAQRGHCCPRPHSLGVAEQGLGRWPCPLPHALDPRAPGQQSLYSSTSGQHQHQ